MVTTRTIDKNALEMEIKEQMKSVISNGKKDWMDELEWLISQTRKLEKEISNLTVVKIIDKDYFEKLDIKNVGENKWAVLIKYKWNGEKHDEEVYEMYLKDMEEEGFKGW